MSTCVAMIKLRAAALAVAAGLFVGSCAHPSPPEKTTDRASAPESSTGGGQAPSSEGTMASDQVALIGYWPVMDSANGEPLPKVRDIAAPSEPEATSKRGICPENKAFDTRYSYHGCACPDGTHKVYLDFLKIRARCQPNDLTCPTGYEFGTTNTWRGCHCPDPLRKHYMNLWSSPAYCAGTCPSGVSFSDSGDAWHCDCPEGQVKEGAGAEQYQCRDSTAPPCTSGAYIYPKWIEVSGCVGEFAFKANDGKEADSCAKDTAARVGGRVVSQRCAFRVLLEPGHDTTVISSSKEAAISCAIASACANCSPQVLAQGACEWR
jgi:hypothetical protein